MPATLTRWNEFLDFSGNSRTADKPIKGVVENLTEAAPSPSGYPADHASFVKALRQQPTSQRSLRESQSFPPGHPHAPLDPSGTMPEKIAKAHAAMARKILDLLATNGTAEERIAKLMQMLDPIAQATTEAYDSARFVARLRSRAHRHLTESDYHASDLARSILRTANNKKLDPSSAIGLIRGKVSKLATKNTTTRMFTAGANLLEQIKRR